MLVICNSIQRKEIKPLERYFSIEDIKQGIRKVEKGLATEISGIKMPGSRLFKVYLTGKHGHGRMSVIFKVVLNWYIPVLIRLKTDRVGKNMTKNNPAFLQALSKNIDLIAEDLEQERMIIL